jgi:hypothetical protein
MGVDDEVLIKPLEDWLTLEEAAQILGLSKQGMHAMVWNSMQFSFDNDVRAVGSRPTYVLRETAVLAKKAEREAAVAARQATSEERAAAKLRVRKRGLAGRA